MIRPVERLTYYGEDTLNTVKFVTYQHGVDTVNLFFINCAHIILSITAQRKQHSKGHHMSIH